MPVSSCVRLFVYFLPSSAASHVFSTLFYLITPNSSSLYLSLSLPLSLSRAKRKERTLSLSLSSLRFASQGESLQANPRRGAPLLPLFGGRSFGVWSTKGCFHPRWVQLVLGPWVSALFPASSPRPLKLSPWAYDRHATPVGPVVGPHSPVQHKCNTIKALTQYRFRSDCPYSAQVPSPPRFITFGCLSLSLFLSPGLGFSLSLSLPGVGADQHPRASRPPASVLA